jgi:hypothetical protein
MVPSSLLATMYCSSGGNLFNSISDRGAAEPPAVKSLLPSGKPGSQPITAIDTAMISGSLNLISNLSVRQYPCTFDLDELTHSPEITELKVTKIYFRRTAKQVNGFGESITQAQNRKNISAMPIPD